MARDCRDCKHFWRDVDLPFPVCRLHEFHFEHDYSPCSDYDGPTDSGSSGSSYSSSSSSDSSGCRGCAIAAAVLVVLVLIGTFVTTGMWSSLLSAIGISSSEEANGIDGQRVMVATNGTSLNLRSDASMKAKVIGKIKNGAVVYIQEEQGDWAKVIVEETGEVGWCSTKYLLREEKAD